MRHITLQAREDEQSGYIGLIIKGMRNLDIVNPATEGRLVAHDLFEHVNGLGNIGGGAGDELIALGALWYVRGQHADLARPNHSIYTPEQSVGYDVGICFRRWYYDGEDFNMPVPKLRREIDRETLGYMLKEVNPKNEGMDEVDAGALFRFLLGARRFLNHGYYLARRKYRNDMRGNTMFWTVSDVLDRDVFRHELSEGQEFTLSYSRYEARVQEKIDYYY